MPHYGSHLQELAQQGIDYTPATVSCFGRRHIDTSKMMMLAARKAARYRGLPDHQALLSRWHRTVATEL
eukprot:7113470-Karenia_brevis.AAC.1